MKTLINTFVLVAVAIGLSACGSTTTNNYHTTTPTKTIKSSSGGGGGGGSSSKKSGNSYSGHSSDPVRSGKIHPDSVEPVRAPSSY